MISVIVIGKNEGDRLADCFQSIEDALKTLQHETIYIDSHSTDDSLRIAASFGAKAFLLDSNETTAGLGRLAGTAQAHGEWLLFLDGDMQLRKGFAEEALKLSFSQGFAAVCGIRDDIYIDETGSHKLINNYFDCRTPRICPEFGGALFIRAEALQKAGGWSGNTVACEEAELHARLLADRQRIAEIPVPMILHTDAVRDTRGLVSTVFSKRRLGEGQALRCALAHHRLFAYLHFERIKYAFFILDALSLIAFIVLFLQALPGIFLFQFFQIGYFLARGRIRAFVSQKLFFFFLIPGILSYHSLDSGCTEVSP